MIVAVIAIGVFATILGASMVAASMQNATASSNMPRRIAGSWVETSIAHNAEGHQSHQAVHFVWPQAGQVYDGKVTFTASKGVDIIAIHDITDQQGNTTGIKTWTVEGRKYATTTLMTNATSGTVDFVGSEILAHSASSDQYTVAFSLDAITMRDTGIHNYVQNNNSTRTP